MIYRDQIIKTFVAWIKVKIKRELSEQAQQFYEGEIWWVSVGQNIGNESNGKNEQFERPVLIIKKFNMGTFWGLAISSQDKSGAYYHTVKIENRIYCFNLSQLRILSSKRLIRRISRLTKAEFCEIRKMITNILLL